MKKINLKAPSFGSWLTSGSPIIAEIMAQAGFDWLVVDMEHSTTSTEVARQMIETIEHYIVVPLVRVAANDPTYIKWAMDAGAYGVIVPLVNSAQEAARAVSAVKYPPVGTRGVGLARAQKYGQGFEEYRSVVNTESTVIVQIEHIEAVRHIREILTTPGVDGFLVGPYDLSGSLGIPGEFSDPRVQDALTTIYSTAKELGIPAGYHIIQPRIEEVKERLAQGFRFLALSLDTLYLGNACRSFLQDARRQPGDHK